MNSTVDFVEGDTGSVMRFAVKNVDGEVYDLTGATAKIRWRHAKNAPEERAATVADAGEGIVTYRWAAGELTPGSRTIEVEIQDAQGRYLTSLDPIVVTIRRELG